GIYAGRAVALSHSEGEETAYLLQYEQKWLSRFGKEFDRLLFLRRILERLDNKSLDKIFSEISSSTVDMISNTGDFDFHSLSLKQFLNSKTTLNMLSTFMGNEYRKIIKDLSKI
ncbi:MAG TPA: dehydrogenase, partial [Candidatus Nitrosocosmicus sp.]|nr:dehydrogenase [Candidatus Nitrosocosmicus sp.]